MGKNQIPRWLDSTSWVNSICTPFYVDTIRIYLQPIDFTENRRDIMLKKYDRNLSFLIELYWFNRTSVQQSMVQMLSGEYFILHLVNSGINRPNELKDTMSISSARIAAALNNLEKKGLLTREIDKNDRRRILITITDEGKKLAEEQAIEIQKKAEEFLRILGERGDEFRSLIREVIRNDSSTSEAWRIHVEQ